MANLVASHLGFLFTQETVKIMRSYFKAVQKDGLTALCWGLAFVEHDKLEASLGADYKAQPLAIADQIEGLVFYWYAELPALDALRAYYIDKVQDKPTQLISLQTRNECHPVE